jgi:hypothetical protein
VVFRENCLKGCKEVYKWSGQRRPVRSSNDRTTSKVGSPRFWGVKILDLRCGNDPSAGSPTETLLRLHLPLNVEV